MAWALILGTRRARRPLCGELCRTRCGDGVGVSPICKASGLSPICPGTHTEESFWCLSTSGSSTLLGAELGVSDASCTAGVFHPS